MTTSENTHTAVSAMRAVRPPGPCAPRELSAVEAPVPFAGPADAVIQVHAAGVNRSDVLACRGLFPGPYPRTLGREYAGRVVEGPEEWLGRLVWGAGGGDLGITRDGTHAEYLTVPVATLVTVPEPLDVVQAGGCALAYFTASAALERTGRLDPGSWVAVSGAVGGVGHAAVALAAWRGARVVSVVRDAEEALAARERGDQHVVTAGDDVTAAVRDLVGGEGVAHVVDAVGGRMAEQLLAAAAPGGGMCVLSSPMEQPITLDVLDFYRRDLSLRGLNTARLTAHHAARALDSLRAGFAEGALTCGPLAGVHDLAEAAAAYEHVEQGRPGRPVLSARPT